MLETLLVSLFMTKELELVRINRRILSPLRLAISPCYKLKS